jgi:hypothetical protein
LNVPLDKKRPRERGDPIEDSVASVPVGSSVGDEESDDSEILPNGFPLYTFIDNFGHELAHRIGANFEVEKLSVP